MSRIYTSISSHDASCLSYKALTRSNFSRIALRKTLNSAMTLMPFLSSRIYWLVLETRSESFGSEQGPGRHTYMGGLDSAF